MELGIKQLPLVMISKFCTTIISLFGKAGSISAFQAKYQQECLSADGPPPDHVQKSEHLKLNTETTLTLE